MKILTQWLRSFVPGLSASDRQLADDLTLRGIAVEGVFGLGPQNGSLFETDSTTNLVECMNHYAVRRRPQAFPGASRRQICAGASQRGCCAPSPFKLRWARCPSALTCWGRSR